MLCFVAIRLEDGISITGYVGMALRHFNVPGFPHHTSAFGKRYVPTLLLC
ncbi:MAG: hypothetical protein IKP37_04715 [Paludibacteraceae bacterium]|nr:hypothetical protein [Paludibacteraceae bacterium]